MSGTAMIKMVMHAVRGGDLEVMGLMTGKIEEGVFIVVDSFPLPVEGTETRVNAGAEAMAYIPPFMASNEQIGKRENCIGWYHSHPGYGCWLSGIDVSTEMLYQQYQEPWMAVVVDPKRTLNANSVQLKAFRTFPAGYVNPNDAGNDMQHVPLEKIEDFGMYLPFM